MSGVPKQWNGSGVYPYHSKDQAGEYFGVSMYVDRPNTVDHCRRIVARLTRRDAEALRDSLTKMLETR